MNTDVEGVRDGSVRGQARKGRNFSSRKKVLGVELSPDNFAVAMVYFVQGVLGLARLAVSFYLKDDLHLDPAEVRGEIFKCFHEQLSFYRLTVM